MIDRLAVLPDGPRRAIAVTLALVSVLVPLGLVWSVAGGVFERLDDRARVVGEVDALTGALAERQAAIVDAGPRPQLARSATAAGRQLDADADRLVAAFEAADAFIEDRTAISDSLVDGVAERRVTLVASGPSAAISEALRDVSRTPMTVHTLWIVPLGEDEARVTLTLVQVLAEAGDEA